MSDKPTQRGFAYVSRRAAQAAANDKSVQNVDGSSNAQQANASLFAPTTASQHATFTGPRTRSRQAAVQMLPQQPQQQQRPGPDASSDMTGSTQQRTGPGGEARQAREHDTNIKLSQHSNVPPPPNSPEFMTPKTAPVSPDITKYVQPSSVLTSFAGTATALKVRQNSQVDLPQTNLNELVMDLDSIGTSSGTNPESLEESKTLCKMLTAARRQSEVIHNLAAFLSAVPERRRQALALDTHYLRLVEAIFGKGREMKADSLIATQSSILDLIRPLQGPLSTHLLNENANSERDKGLSVPHNSSISHSRSDNVSASEFGKGRVASDPRSQLAKGSFGSVALSLFENSQDATEFLDMPLSSEEQYQVASSSSSTSNPISRIFGSLFKYTSSSVYTDDSEIRSTDSHNPQSSSKYMRRTNVLHKPVASKPQSSSSALSVIASALTALGMGRDSHGLGVISTYCALLMRHAFGSDVPLNLQGVLFKILFEDSRQFIKRTPCHVDIFPRPIRSIFTLPDVYRWQILQPGFVLPIFAEKLPFVMNSSIMAFIKTAALSMAQARESALASASNGEKIPDVAQLQDSIIASIFDSLLNYSSPSFALSTVNALAQAKSKVTSTPNSPSSQGSSGEVSVISPVESFLIAFAGYVLYHYSLERVPAQARQRLMIYAGSAYSAILEEYLEYFLPTGACQPFSGAWLLELATRASQLASDISDSEDNLSLVSPRLSVRERVPKEDSGLLGQAIASAAGFNATSDATTPPGLSRAKQVPITSSDLAAAIVKAVAARGGEIRLPKVEDNFMLQSRTAQTDASLSANGVIERLIAGDSKLTQLAAGNDLGTAVNRLLEEVASTPLVSNHAASATFIQILTEFWLGQNSHVVNPWALAPPVLSSLSLVDSPSAREVFFSSVTELSKIAATTYESTSQFLQNQAEICETVSTSASSQTQASRSIRRAQGAIATYARSLSSYLGLSPQSRSALGLDLGMGLGIGSHSGDFISSGNSLFSSSGSQKSPADPGKSASVSAGTLLNNSSPYGGAGPVLRGAARSVAAGIVALTIATSDELTSCLSTPSSSSDPSTKPLANYVIGPHRNAAGSWPSTILAALARDRFKWRGIQSSKQWASTLEAVYQRVGTTYTPGFNPTVLNASLLKEVQQSPDLIAKNINIGFETISAHVAAVVSGYVPDTDGEDSSSIQDISYSTQDMHRHESYSQATHASLTHTGSSKLNESRVALSTSASSSTTSTGLRNSAFSILDDGGLDNPITARLEHTRSVTALIHAILSRPELHSSVIHESAADLLLAPSGDSSLYAPFMLAAEALTPSLNTSYKCVRSIDQKNSLDREVMPSSPAVIGKSSGGLRGLSETLKVAELASPLILPPGRHTSNNEHLTATASQVVEAGVTPSGAFAKTASFESRKGFSESNLRPSTAGNAVDEINSSLNSTHLVHVFPNPRIAKSVITAARRFEPVCSPDRIISLSLALSSQYSSRSSLPPSPATVSAFYAAVGALRALGASSVRPRMLQEESDQPFSTVVAGGLASSQPKLGAHKETDLVSRYSGYPTSAGYNTSMPGSKNPTNFRLNSLASVAARYNPQLAAADLVPPEVILVQRHLFQTLSAAFGSVSSMMRESIVGNPSFSFTSTLTAHSSLNSFGAGSSHSNSDLSARILANAGSQKWNWMPAGKWRSSFDAQAVNLLATAEIGLDWLRPWQFSPTSPDSLLEHMKKKSASAGDVLESIAILRAKAATRKGLSVTPEQGSEVIDGASRYSAKGTIERVHDMHNRFHQYRRQYRSANLEDMDFDELMWGTEIDTSLESEYATLDRPGESEGALDRVVGSSRRLARKIVFRKAVERAASLSELDINSSSFSALETSAGIHCSRMLHSLSSDEEFIRRAELAEKRSQRTLMNMSNANADDPILIAIAAAAACDPTYSTEELEDLAHLPDPFTTSESQTKSGELKKDFLKHVVANSVTHGMTPEELDVLNKCSPEALTIILHSPQSRTLVSAASAAAIDSFSRSLPVTAAVAAARFAVARVSNAGYGILTLLAHKVGAGIAKGVASTAASVSTSYLNQGLNQKGDVSELRESIGFTEMAAKHVPKQDSVPLAVLKDILTQPSLGHSSLREDTIAVRYRGYILANLPFYSSLTLNAMSIAEGLLYDSLWHHPFAPLPNLHMDEQSGTPPFLQNCLARVSAKLAECSSVEEAVHQSVSWVKDMRKPKSTFSQICATVFPDSKSNKGPRGVKKSRDSSGKEKDPLAPLRVDVLDISSKEADLLSILEDYLEMFNGPSYILGGDVRRLVTASEVALSITSKRALCQLAPAQLGDLKGARNSRLKQVMSISERLETAALALNPMSKDAAESARAYAKILRKQVQDNDVHECTTDERMTAIIARSRNRKDTPVFGFDITNALETPYSSLQKQQKKQQRKFAENGLPRSYPIEQSTKFTQAEVSPLKDQELIGETYVEDTLGPRAILPFELVNEHMRAKLGLGTATCALHSVGGGSGVTNFTSGFAGSNVTSSVGGENQWGSLGPSYFNAAPLPAPVQTNQPIKVFGIIDGFSSERFLAEIVSRVTTAPVGLYCPLIPPLPAHITLPLIQAGLESSQIHPGSVQKSIGSISMDRSLHESGSQMLSRRITRSQRGATSSSQTSSQSEEMNTSASIMGASRGGTQPQRLAVALAGSPLMQSTLRAVSLRRLAYHVRTRRAKYLHTLRHCELQLEDHLAQIEALAVESSYEVYDQRLRKLTSNPFYPAIPPFPPVCTANPEPEDSICRKLTRIIQHMDVIFGLPEFNFAAEFPSTFVIVPSEDLRQKCIQASQKDIFSWSIAFGEGVGIHPAALGIAQQQHQLLLNMKSPGASSVTSSVLASVQILASVGRSNDPFHISDRVFATHIMEGNEVGAASNRNAEENVGASKALLSRGEYFVASDNQRVTTVQAIIKRELENNPWAGPIQSDEIDVLFRFWKRFAHAVAPLCILVLILLRKAFKRDKRKLDFNMDDNDEHDGWLSAEDKKLLSAPPIPNLRPLSSWKTLAQIMLLVILFVVFVKLFVLVIS